MRELADRMVAIAQRRLAYRGRVVSHADAHADYLRDNPNRRCPQIAKARSHLGDDPQVGIDDGLERSLVWYSGNAEAEEG